MLSGMARSMPALIAMRVVQGLGAGAVGPIVLTMLGDLFTIEERARVQGLFSAVWGLSSLAGPALRPGCPRRPPLARHRPNEASLRHECMMPTSTGVDRIQAGNRKVTLMYQAATHSTLITTSNQVITGRD